MIKRTVPLLLLAALVLPTAAAAENTELSGPLLVKGRGALRGEVKMANPAETRPLVFAGQGGLVRFVDLAGDLRVDGHCRALRADGESEGRKTFVCRGRGGRARVHGSHFRVAARLRTYAMAIPRGATAHLRGNYVTFEPGAEPDGERERPKRERADQERPKQERPERPGTGG